MKASKDRILGAPHPEELGALWRVSPPWLRPIIELCAATGLQPSDIEQLRWSDLADGGGWKLARGERPPVYLTQSALAAIAPLPARSKRARIFPRVTASRLDAALSRASRRAGLEVGFRELRQFSINSFLGCYREDEPAKGGAQ
jgi:integrase